MYLPCFLGKGQASCGEGCASTAKDPASTVPIVEVLAMATNVPAVVG
jgi:hypothetical protein